MHRGDDLEDDFVFDNIVAFSENEAAPDGPFFSDENDATPDEDEPPNTSFNPGLPSPNTAARQKRKRLSKEKERKVKKLKLVEPNNVVLAAPVIAASTPQEISDFLAKKQATSLPELSSFELEDIRIPPTSITDTTTWTPPRTLDHLVDFIINTIPPLHTRLSQRSKNNGSPTLLFVTGAALRVADVTRVLKDKRLRGDKGGDVAKLFARHFKLAEHVAYLRRTKVAAAVGTPGRLGKLLCETDALTISALSHIMLDVTYQDAKKRSFLDIPETRNEVFRNVLGGPAVQKAIKQGKIQVVVF